MTGLIPDTDYKFKVAAKNFYGWGIDSFESTVTATLKTFPDQVTGVTTTLSNDGLKIRIAWGAYVTNGDPID